MKRVWRESVVKAAMKTDESRWMKVIQSNDKIGRQCEMAGGVGASGGAGTMMG